IVFTVFITLFITTTRRERALRDNVETETRVNARSIRRINPSLAYIYARRKQDEQHFDDTSKFTRFLHRLDTAKDAYLEYSVPTYGDLVQAIAYPGLKQLALTDERSVTT